MHSGVGMSVSIVEYEVKLHLIQELQLRNLRTLKWGGLHSKQSIDDINSHHKASYLPQRNDYALLKLNRKFQLRQYRREQFRDDTLMQVWYPGIFKVSIVTAELCEAPNMALESLATNLGSTSEMIGVQGCKSDVALWWTVLSFLSDTRRLLHIHKGE